MGTTPSQLHINTVKTENEQSYKGRTMLPRKDNSKNMGNHLIDVIALEKLFDHWAYNQLHQSNVALWTHEQSSRCEDILFCESMGYAAK